METLIMQALMYGMLVPIGYSAAILAIELLYRINCTEKAIGIVIDVEETEKMDVDGNWRMMTCPVCRFEANGEVYTISGKKTKNLSCQRGDEVIVHYNPKNPKEFYTNIDKTHWLSASILGIISIILYAIVIKKF